MLSSQDLFPLDVLSHVLEIYNTLRAYKREIKGKVSGKIRLNLYSKRKRHHLHPFPLSLVVSYFLQLKIVNICYINKTAFKTPSQLELIEKLVEQKSKSVTRQKNCY